MVIIINISSLVPLHTQEILHFYALQFNVTHALTVDLNAFNLHLLVIVMFISK